MTVPLRLAHESAAHPPGPGLSDGRSPDPVAAWLDVLSRMLPRRQAADIREELEEHVRDRVRDLVLAGQDEHAAVRAAIAELGDAASVAHRFRDAARIPKRRLAMNFAVLGVAGAALVTSLVGLVRPGSNGAGPAVYQPGSAERVTGGPEPRVPPLNLQRGSLQDALSFIAESANLTLQVRWMSLASDAGLEPSTPVTASAPAGPVSAAFDAINGALSGSPDEPALDFRLHEGVLEVARPNWFDRRESTLVRYDLDPLDAHGVSSEDFMAAVMQFVSTTDWEDNGGGLARQRIVGRFAFVQGPPRVHEGVRWFLAQFTEGEKRPGPGAAAEAGEALRVYHIQYTDAQDLLHVLMSMQSIREVDFTPWVADTRTNSILGRAPAPHHALVERAIKDLDTADAHLKKRAGPGPAQPAERFAAAELPAEEFVYLSGQVSRPGTYSLAPGLTLRRSLIAAGGLNEGATAVRLLRTREGQEQVIHEYPAGSLDEPGEDPVLHPGDRIVAR